MTQTAPKYEHYLSDYKTRQAKSRQSAPLWLREMRKHALASFGELGFPTDRKDNEKWKYTNVGPIANTIFNYSETSITDQKTQEELRRVAPWNENWTNMVFVNGHYSEALSTNPKTSDPIVVSCLALEFQSNSKLVEQHLGRYASSEADGFAALNTAFLQDGAVVHIPEGETLVSPLNLIFLSTDQGRPSVSHPRVLVIAGARSKASIIESYVGIAQSRSFTNTVAEITIGEGAEIDHYRILTEGAQSFHIGMARVHQHDNSVFSSRSFVKGPAIGRYDLNVLLDGPGSSCTLNGLYITSGNQHMDNYINIDHSKPHTTSRLNYKGVLDGKSRAVFGGTVYVREGAIKADSLQSDKNLILSPNAEVDSKPALFIYADDVKCGHGATAGNIDQDTVFYMRSRGLDLDTASRLLIYGFAREIIDTVHQEHLSTYLEELFLDALPSYRFEF